MPTEPVKLDEALKEIAADWDWWFDRSPADRLAKIRAMRAASPAEPQPATYGVPPDEVAELDKAADEAEESLRLNQAGPQPAQESRCKDFSSEYIAWIRYEHGLIRVCDSDDAKAFPVYKWATVEGYSSMRENALREAMLARANELNKRNPMSATAGELRQWAGRVAEPQPAGETPIQICMYCPHPVHPRGQKCGAPNPKKPCKCKAGAGFWDSLGNAIGESLFGGNR